MGTKEQISAGYIAEWHERTQNWEYPSPRRALVVGCDPGNIGEAIAAELESAMDPVDYNCSKFFHTVIRRNKDNLDLGQIGVVSQFPWHVYDTVVFANGETRLNWIEDQTLMDIASVIRNKMTGTMYGVSEFVRQTINHAWIKNIVVIGSMAHGSVLNGSAPYCAACAGLVHFARCAAWELAPKGYRIFIVNPSNTEGTPMTEATIQGLMTYRNLSRDQAESYWSAVRAIPKWLQTDNIANIVRTLVTEPDFEWLSGTPLDLGGGLR